MAAQKTGGFLRHPRNVAVRREQAAARKSVSNAPKMRPSTIPPSVWDDIPAPWNDRCWKSSAKSRKQWGRHPRYVQFTIA